MLGLKNIVTLPAIYRTDVWNGEDVGHGARWDGIMQEVPDAFIKSLEIDFDINDENDREKV